MNYFDNYLMKPILGILTKKGADIAAHTRSTYNLPFMLHYFAKSNVSTRRLAGYCRTPAIRYHRSRSMGGY